MRRPHRTSQRFDLARLVGDHFWAMGNGDMLLPATLAVTARQKFQRAFAQELLCPFEDVRERMAGGVALDELVEEAVRD